jgi:hypothetical protein
MFYFIHPNIEVNAENIPEQILCPNGIYDKIYHAKAKICAKIKNNIIIVFCNVKADNTVKIVAEKYTTEGMNRSRVIMDCICDVGPTINMVLPRSKHVPNV